MSDVRQRFDATVRAGFVRRAQRVIDEIDQMFTEAASWNDNHPREAPIDVDPDGELAAARATAQCVVDSGGLRR